MLLVRVVVRPSPIHGLGAFADEPIAEGTPVWRFTPGFDLDLNPAELERQPEHFRKVLLHYGYLDKRLQRYILCCDDARFINHAGEPNLASDFTQDPYGVDIAARDISAGEELTIDYALIESPRSGGESVVFPRVRLFREGGMRPVSRRRFLPSAGRHTHALG